MLTKETIERKIANGELVKGFRPIFLGKNVYDIKTLQLGYLVAVDDNDTLGGHSDCPSCGGGSVLDLFAREDENYKGLNFSYCTKCGYVDETVKFPYNLRIH